MSDTDTTVQTLLATHESGTAIPTRLSYDTDTPLVIQARFQPSGQRHVTWPLARDLLLRGCTTPEWVGGGDVRLRATDSQLQLYLSTPDGHASFHMPLPALSGFLGCTLQEKPLGGEVDDDALDHLVNSLLGRCVS